MGNSVIQPSLTGGEIGPALYGRVDIARYLNSLKTCRNFIVRPYGGASNRSGTKLVAEVKDSSAKVRLIPFQFNTSQTYILELGNHYMRVNMNGAPVLSGGSPVEVATPWGTADLAALKFTQSADVMTVCHPSYQPRSISRTSHTAWSVTLYDFSLGPFQSINIQEGVTVSASAATGNVLLSASAAIFSAASVGMLFYLEQKDFGTPWEVAKAVVAGDIRRSEGKYYLAQNGGTTGTLKPSHVSGVWSDGAVNWLYLHPGFGCALITSVAGDGKSAGAAVKSRLPDAACFVTSTAKTITAIANSGGMIQATSNAHGFSNGQTINVTIAYLDGGGGTQSLVGSYLVTVVDANTFFFGNWSELVNFSSFTSGSAQITGSTSASASYKWAFGAWGGDQGWPSCTVYHQQRQVFAATPQAPQTLWFSKTGDYHNFGTSNPVTDDDAITATVASTQVNTIKSLLPLDKLVLLTAGGEWIVSGGSSDVLTPTSLACKLQGYRGASDVPPLGIGNNAIYVQGKGRSVRDLGYEFASDSYNGVDLMTFAPHLVEHASITEWTYQQSPFSAIWAIREDGVLLCCTYLREQQVAGWSWHDTDGTFESVACVSEGTEDAVYVVVKRTIGGVTKRFIERFQTRLVTDQREAFFVDCGLTFDGRTGYRGTATDHTNTTMTLSGGTTWDQDDSLTATASASFFAYPATTDVGDQLVYWDDDEGIAYRLTITSVTSTTSAKVRPNRLVPVGYRSSRTDWAIARDSISGLGHLEGKTVSILADGLVQAQQVVSGGRITISPPAYVVHAGLPYASDIQTLNVVVQGDNFIDKVKNIGTVRMLVQESRSIWAGRDVDHLYESKPRSTENYDLPPNLQSGLIEIPIACTWSKDGSFVVRQTAPLPITVLALMPEVTTGGR